MLLFAGWVTVLCGFFFFEAEDGIRDFHVTGVQTCALPISLRGRRRRRRGTLRAGARGGRSRRCAARARRLRTVVRRTRLPPRPGTVPRRAAPLSARHLSAAARSTRGLDRQPRRYPAAPRPA